MSFPHKGYKPRREAVGITITMLVTATMLVKNWDGEMVRANGEDFPALSMSIQ